MDNGIRVGSAILFWRKIFTSVQIQQYIDWYQKLAKIFQHSDILFRFQRILSIQAKACKDLSSSGLNRQTYTHNKRFKHAFENLRLSLEKLRDEQQYDQILGQCSIFTVSKLKVD